MTIYPRSTIGVPKPPTTRRKLDRVDVLIAHEVGVDTPATGRYRSSDPVRVLSDASAAAAYGVASNRPWEYSYMIGLDGSIFTQAGEYMAAHCLNFNTQSAGVIFLNATDVQVNDAQIAAWFEVRGHMVAEGILAAEHDVAPHYRYRATSCPGIRAQPPGGPWESPTGQGRLGNLIAPLLAAPQPPPPSELPMRYIAQPPAELAGQPWLVVWDGAVRYATSHDTQQGLPFVVLNSEQYVWLKKSAGLA